jgi:hypothetical protein
MLRREFLEKGLSTVITLSCPCSIHAKPLLTGCRAVVKGDTGAYRFVDKTGYYLIDLHFKPWRDQLMQAFGVRPGVTFYQDSERGNALAVPEQLLTDGPDGTVMVGVNLVNQESQREGERINRCLRLNQQFSDMSDKLGIADKYESPDCFIFPLTTLIIMAHEFGHIVQFKHGMKVDGPWQMEPHADYLAGWYIGRRGDVKLDSKTFHELVDAIFLAGDTDFGDKTHHGEPDFRAVMVRAGYDAHALELQQAFDKGCGLLELH